MIKIQREQKIVPYLRYVGVICSLTLAAIILTRLIYQYIQSNDVSSVSLVLIPTLISTLCSAIVFQMRQPDWKINHSGIYAYSPVTFRPSFTPWSQITNISSNSASVPCSYIILEQIGENELPNRIIELPTTGQVKPKNINLIEAIEALHDQASKE